ncbi:MAG: hypothetical protein GEU99_20230 [Luteitalea sp.]|nr:hypothetical protein [Luteitalea sp.]
MGERAEPSGHALGANPVGDAHAGHEDRRPADGGLIDHAGNPAVRLVGGWCLAPDEFEVKVRDLFEQGHRVVVIADPPRGQRSQILGDVDLPRHALG